MNTRIKKSVLYALVLTAAVLLIVFSETAKSAAQDAVTLCLSRLVPALFPFFALSGFVSCSGCADDLGAVLGSVMYPLFGVSGKGALPLLLGFCGGYPVSAKTISEMYLRGELTKSEASRLLLFACNTGPAVIFGLCASALFSSAKAGIILYVIHILSAILIGIFAKLLGGACEIGNSRGQAKERKSISVCFVSSVLNASESMINVCAFVVIFSVILAIIKAFIPQGTSALLLTGLSELTSGLALLRDIAPDTTRAMCLASLFIGFGGLCVYMQSASFIVPAGLSTLPYILGKALHGILSCFITLLCMVYSKCTEAFSFTGQTVTKEFIFDYIGLFYSCACFLAGILLLLRWKIKHRHDL